MVMKCKELTFIYAVQYQHALHNATHGTKDGTK